MLISCPECSRNVSSKADVCLGCGVKVGEVMYELGMCTKCGSKNTERRYRHDNYGYRTWSLVCSCGDWVTHEEKI